MTKFRLRLSASLLPLAALGLAAGSLVPAPRAAYAQEDVAEDTATPTITSETGWGFPVYDIPADPAVRYGVLDNGMKYAIMKNATPQKQVVLRMGFDVGFVDELPGQYNSSHFIEHMAFNGSTHVPEGEMIKLLERNGLAFGADTNASTSFEETIYKLDLPRNDAELLDTGLMLMREVGSELTIEPAAVDRERGVLQSEIQTRNTFGLRNIVDYFLFIAPGTKFAENLANPAQPATTAAITADQLRAAYARYYRPDNATLVVVGDIDPAEVEGKIKARFSDWQKPQTPLPDLDTGKINLDRQPEANVFVDPAIPYQVMIDRFGPYRDHPTTIAEGRRMMLVGLASAIVNRRLAKITRQADAPILGGDVSASDFFDLAAQSTMIGVAKDGEWQKALATLEHEYRRAMEFGFTQAELTEALANMETGIRNGAEREATRRSADLAGAILGTVSKESLFVAPSTRLEIFEQIKADATPEAVHNAYKQAFAGSAPLIHVSSKLPIEGGADAVLATYSTATKQAVAPPVEQALAEFGYSDFGPAGTVVSDTTVDDLGFRELRFANNVMLNLKKTDFKDKEILFHIRVGSGELAFGKEYPAEPTFMNSMFASAGLGKHSLDELQQILAGQNIAVGFGTAGDHFHMSGSTKAADVKRQMQVSAAFLTDPGYRPEADERWQALIPPYVARLDATPQSVAQSKVPNIIANGDPRFGVPSEEVLLSANLDELKAVITPLMADAPIEITVVGDIDENAVIEAVAETFGALPTRKAELEEYAEAREVSFAKDRSPRTLYHTGAADQGMIQVVWPTTDDDDYQQEVIGRLATEALQLRLTEVLREELGATYSPSAGLSMSDVYDDFGYASAVAIVAPENQGKVFEVIETITAELRDKPIDEDILNRARNPMLERLTQRRRENGYWLGIMEAAQLEADRLDRTRNYETLLRSVTPEQIQAFARQYFRTGEELRVAIVPKPAEK